MDKRTITVKGIGNIKVKADYAVITMKLETTNLDYEKMMHEESVKVKELTNALVKIGIESNEIKTTDFNIEQVYESVRDINGNYKNEFKGYECRHTLKISFDYSMELLTNILNAITKCKSNPQFNVEFTIKDSSKVNEELLKTATINAMTKAKILCESSGNKLGQLLSIDYNFKDKTFHSNTNYLLRNAKPLAVGINIEPN